MIKKTLVANDRPDAEEKTTSPPFFQIRTWDESRTNRISSNYYEDVFIQKSEGSSRGKRSAGMHSSNPSLIHAAVAGSPLRSSMSEENLRDSGSYRRLNAEDDPDGVMDNHRRGKTRSSEWFTYHPLNKPLPPPQPPLDHDSLRHCHPQSHQKYTRETYYAFENIDWSGQVLSWTEIVTIQSVHDCISISGAIYV